MENNQKMPQEVTSQEALFLYQQNIITMDECQYYMDLRADIIRKAIIESKNNNQSGIEPDVKLI